MKVKNTLISAADAKKASNEQAVLLAAKKAEKAKRSMESEKHNLKKLKKEFLDKWSAEISACINTAISHGETSINLILGSFDSPKDDLYGMKYLDNSTFAPEVKKIIKNLKNQGYAAVVVAKCSTHDNTTYDGDFLNNYYMYDTVLEVTW
jgi:hypothetical protein